jgi:hypothetical protein
VEGCKSDKEEVTKISAHLFDWFKKPITAKELDVDAFGMTPLVERKYDSFQSTSKKGKNQSEDDIMNKDNPLEATKDELIGQLLGNNQPVTRF